MNTQEQFIKGLIARRADLVERLLRRADSDDSYEHIGSILRSIERQIDHLDEEIKSILAEDCHCDPTDNFECNKHVAERLLAKAKS